VSGEAEVSSSSGGRAMPKLRLKKRHDKGCIGDVGVSEKRSKKVRRMAVTVTLNMRSPLRRPWLMLCSGIDAH